MRNSEALTKSLNSFAREKKINDSYWKILRESRNKIVDLIKEYSKKCNLAIIDKFNVGSYKIKTGVKRKGELNQWAFDIDYVIAYKKEFNYENFKNNLVAWLRKKAKEKYNVIVSNKKKVISIAFRDEKDEKTIFFLDIAIYIKWDDKLYHIKRNSNDEYIEEEGEPKKTYERQREELSQNEDKRFAIIVLKYLKNKDRIKGISSIFITESIIKLSNDLDTFSLIKEFIYNNKDRKIPYDLIELPHSNLIDDYEKLNTSLKMMKEKFFKSNTTFEVYNAMNSWLDNQLPSLDKELFETRNERYSGG